MAASPLLLANRTHARAYAGIVKWLKADPTLARVVGCWRTWEGSDDDDAPFAPDCGVGVGITPSTGPAEQITIANGSSPAVWDRPLDLAIEAGVEEVSAANLLDVASLISARLNPSDPATAAALAARLDPLMVMSILELQPMTAAPADPRQPMATIAGKFRLEMMF